MRKLDIEKQKLRKQEGKSHGDLNLTDINSLFLWFSWLMLSSTCASHAVRETTPVHRRAAAGEAQTTK